jgi:thiol-disulfide isomerase/thioredoxin
MIRCLSLLAGVVMLASTCAACAAQADGGMSAWAWLDEPEPAPDVAFTVEGGETRTLQDFSGKVIVLNFWAVWCPPCREEMPSLDRLQGAYGGDNLVVITMSEDRGGEEQILEFYDKIDVEHLGVFSDSAQKLAREFRVLGMPTTYIIDHNGNQVAKLVGAAEWDSEAALSRILPLVEQAAGAAGDGTAEQASLESAP